MDQTTDIKWRNETTPVSRRFDDPYYSIDDGLAETRHVFLAGNGLPDRFSPGFHIGELGFGTGLNLLTAWLAWEHSGVTGPLYFSSFEAFPLQPADMARALANFPELASKAELLLDHWPGQDGQITLPGLVFSLIAGDARLTLPDWNDAADAWFLDGFSPAKNPELWGAKLMKQVASHTSNRGTFATYTAAGDVRRTLARAGFDVVRAPGYGRKRHMTTGRLASQ